MTRAALFACLALAACSRPVTCVVTTAAEAPKVEAVGHVENGKGIKITIVKATQDTYTYRLIGTMENVSGQTLASAQIQCKFFDAAGHTMRGDDDYGFNMKPGEVKNLSIELWGHDAPAKWACAVLSVQAE